MLPLPLYFSDEFRLITANQLLRGVQQAALSDVTLLQKALQSLDLTFINQVPVSAQPTPVFPEYSPPAPAPQVFTTEQANHHFNVCLKRIEAASTASDDRPAAALINPAQLQPNCHPDAGEPQTSALVRKLVALAQIAGDQQVSLLLTLPRETELELWLHLLAQLLAEPGLEASIGIELSAESPRLLPTLGYLERLSLDHQIPLPVRLFQHGYRHAGCDSASPRADDLVRLNLAAACAFLESRNNGHLQPQLVLSDPGLAATTLHALHQDHGWPIHLLPRSTPACHVEPPLEAAFPWLQDGLNSIHEQSAHILAELQTQPPRVTPVIRGVPRAEQEARPMYQPAASSNAFGTLVAASEEQTREAFASCTEALISGRDQSPGERQAQVEKLLTLLSEHQLKIASICALETGKPIRDGLLELQDGLLLIREHLQLMPQITATQYLPASGPACCSLVPVPMGTLLTLLPWSQPIFQFCSMTSAALLTGNALLIKPAHRASQVVSYLFSLLLQTGINPQQVALLPGQFATTGKFLLEDYRLDGVLFCGNAYAATDVQQRLSKRLGAPMLSMLSDTGGRHAALIDDDQSITELLPRLLQGAFAQAGQHPASLRVLYVEEKIAEEVERELIQALPHLRVGAPEKRATDIGPLISREQMERAHLHIERFRARGCLIAQPELKAELEDGYFVPPALLRLFTLDELQEQIDGPLLHLVRFSRDEISRPLDEINRSGFAMALTLFSDDSALCERVARQARVREFNLNPSDLHPNNPCCPGAGLGLSGTAPRPGTVNYLRALVRHQRVRQAACKELS